MKNTFNVILWSYVVTIALYITVIFGMLAQILLGAIHVIAAIYIYSRYNSLPNKNKAGLNIYSALVVSYFIGLGLVTQWGSFNNDMLVISYLFVIPMLIGAYFIWVVYQFRNMDESASVKPDTEILD